MKLSRREVPLYGEAKVYASIEGCEDTELFVVLEGSTLKHTVPVRHHNMFYFIAPGHNCEERVCVQAFRHSGDGLELVGVAYLWYVADDAQHLAEFLVTHSNQLTASTHRLLIGQYNLSDSCMRAQMDRRVTMATANLHLPLTLLLFKPQESLLHVAVRLGFECLLEFLLSQPGALLAASAANEHGDTPLHLAQLTNQMQILRLLSR
ncbi:rho guanine nucleotide exchange factor 28 [Engraulis encrasicolus]|uniref:rho guanine nucleotide exchange factor 28 n=1 Tax=Engraulis encrasicolus TaxID=184585 RepID=UPI002FD2EFCC